MFMDIKDSCILVYTTNRIGDTNLACSGSTGKDTTTTTQERVLPKNNRKFEQNGCSKVDREDTCKVSLFRG
jgi:hypothetical protein